MLLLLTVRFVLLQPFFNVIFILHKSYIQVYRFYHSFGQLAEELVCFNCASKCFHLKWRIREKYKYVLERLAPLLKGPIKRKQLNESSCRKYITCGNNKLYILDQSETNFHKIKCDALRKTSIIIIHFSPTSLRDRLQILLLILTHHSPVLLFCTHWKYQKTFTL